MKNLLLALLAAILASGCVAPKVTRLDEPSELRAKYQTPLNETESAMLANNPALSRAIIFGLERNAGLQSMKSEWLAAIHRMPQSTSLPDPMAEGGYQFRDTPMGEEWRLGISQELPWWQKLWARGKVSQRDADIARLKYEADARDLVIAIKNSWYELYYLDQAIPVTEQIAAILRNQGTIAYAELNSGRAQIGEAFRAESQAAQLEYDLILLKEQRAAEAERFKALLNLPHATTIGPVTYAPTYELTHDLPALYERAEQYSDVLQISGLEIQRAEYETFMAKLERIPDISAGLGTTRFAPEMDDSAQSLEGMLSLNLPIWEQRNRAMIDERKAMEEAARQSALQDSNDVRAAVSGAYYRASVARRLVALYRETLVPQAQGVMQQAQVLYRGNQTAFASMIETTIAYHNFTLAAHRATADYGRAIGDLEMLAGTLAAPQPAEVGECAP